MVAPHRLERATYRFWLPFTLTWTISSPTALFDWALDATGVLHSKIVLYRLRPQMSRQLAPWPYACLAQDLPRGGHSGPEREGAVAGQGIRSEWPGDEVCKIFPRVVVESMMGTLFVLYAAHTFSSSARNHQPMPY
jgi:hypothetical protein